MNQQTLRAYSKANRNTNTRRLHLRSWSDRDGFAWADMCCCDIQRDHDATAQEIAEIEAEDDDRSDR